MSRMYLWTLLEPQWQRDKVEMNLASKKSAVAGIAFAWIVFAAASLALRA